MSAGSFHICGLRPDRTATCWGANDEEQSNPPTGTFTALAAGFQHTCGLRPNGTATCWGADHSGQATPLAGTFTALTAGNSHMCGIRTDGTAECWGENHLGQATPPSGTFTALAAGDTHTCGIETSGAVICWGGGDQGQALPPEGLFTAITADFVHTCGIRIDGTAACWGGGSTGEADPPPETFTMLSAGGSHTCGLRPDRTVECWGNDTEGQATPPAGLELAMPGDPLPPSACDDNAFGPFPDVPPDHAFCMEIEWAASVGITTGYEDGTYRPAAIVTRQAMAAFLYRAEGEPVFTPPGTPTFTDVPLTHPFYAEIEWLAAEGIADGYPDDTYRPAATVTRQAMAAFLHRAANEPPFTPPSTATFTDVPLTHPFFPEIEWLAAENIADGYPDGTYRPTTTVTRQATAAFLLRAS